MKKNKIDLFNNAERIESKEMNAVVGGFSVYDDNDDSVFDDSGDSWADDDGDSVEVDGGDSIQGDGGSSLFWDGRAADLSDTP